MHCTDLVALQEVVPRCRIVSLHSPIAVHKAQPPCVVTVVIHIHYVCCFLVRSHIGAASDGLCQVPWARVLPQVLRQICVPHLPSHSYQSTLSQTCCKCLRSWVWCGVKLRRVCDSVERFAHLRIIMEEGDICDGVYSECGVWVTCRHALLVGKDSHIQHIYLAPL